VVRDRDIWFSVQDETETSHIFHETETFGIVSRDRDSMDYLHHMNEVQQIKLKVTPLI